MNPKLQELFTAIAVDNDYNFYSTLLFKCRVIEDESIGTAAVGYLSGSLVFFYNPTFLFGLTRQDQIAVCRHEMLHIMYLHFSRIGARDQKIHNIAADITINNDIIKTVNSDSIFFGKDVANSRNYNLPENLTSEEYYDLILNDDSILQKCSGAGACGEDLIESEEMSDLDKEIIKAEVREAVKKAKQKAIGNIPQEVLRAIDFLYEPAKVDWRDALRDLTGNRRVAYGATYKKPSRRFQKRLEIPGKIRKEGFTLACVVDVSGSMSDEEISEGLNEIREICSIMGTAMYLVQVDTQASEPELFEQFQNKFERKRSGGTNLFPGYEKLVENEIEMDAVLLITDGVTSQEIEWSNISIPVFVLCTQDYCGLHIGNNMSLYKLK